MRRLAPWTAVPVVLCALAWPAASGAVSVTVGRADLSSAASPGSGCEGPSGCQSFKAVNTALSTGARLTAPADGALLNWRVVGTVSGEGFLRLQVSRRESDGSLTPIATTANADAVNGITPSLASLPLAVGDTISIFGGRGTNFNLGDARVNKTSAPGGAWADVGFSGPPFIVSSPPHADQELLYNATVDLFPPALSNVTPQSGSGGTVVTITGQHLAVVTGVTFGGVPATNVSGDNGRITATAPPRPQGGAVDVQVTTAGGTSVGLPLDVFTYPAPPPGPATAPKVSSVALSPATFRAVNAGGSVFAVKTGTRVSYTLSAPATTTFTVKRAKPGRRVGKRCAVPKRSNRRKPRCTRLVAVRGSFKLTGVTGTNRFNFSGRMNRHALAPGGYRLYAVAKNTAGKTSRTVSRGFRIVSR